MQSQRIVLSDYSKRALYSSSVVDLNSYGYNFYLLLKSEDAFIGFHTTQTTCSQITKTANLNVCLLKCLKMYIQGVPNNKLKLPFSLFAILKCPW